MRSVIIFCFNHSEEILRSAQTFMGMRLVFVVYRQRRKTELRLYHRERIYFSSTLSCIKEKGGKSPNLPKGAWAPCQSSNQKGLEPPANQVSNKGAPQQPSRQIPTIYTLQLNFPPPPHMAWDLLLLPAPTADPSSLLTPRPWGDHIPLLIFWAWNPLMRPRGLGMAF